MDLDRERFSRVFRENRAGVCRFLTGILGDEHAAQDIGQEVFVRLLQTGLDAIEPGQERFWLYRVARNLAINEAKRLSKHTSLQQQVRGLFQRATRTPHDILESGERHARLKELILALPEGRRAALLLRELQGMSYKEIAEVLGVSVSKVKVDIFRARQDIRHRWHEPSPASK